MAVLENIGYGNRKYKCLIHLDRLSLTFRHWSGSTFHDTRNPDHILNEQVFGRLTLLYDCLPGLGGFYHSYKVLYDGISVGRLHTATKLKKHELQFDFDKQVFYSFHSEYWYEVYTAVKQELGVFYNNIMYMEISIDTGKNLVEQYAYYFQNSINNKLSLGNQYKIRGKTKVHVLENGASFVIDGSDCEISIYNKSIHAEKYILDYFLKNCLNEQAIFRVESRMKWDYIRYLRNRKGLDITVESLRDSGKLAKIFQLSSNNKMVFLDLKNKEYDENRNAHYKKINILDDLQIETSEIGKLNEELRNSHYKSERVDENIIRQNYYRFLETGDYRYLRNFKYSMKIAGFGRDKRNSLIAKFNLKYRGNRTTEITLRMEDAMAKISGNRLLFSDGFLRALVLKLKLNLLNFL